MYLVCRIAGRVSIVLLGTSVTCPRNLQVMRCRYNNIPAISLQTKYRRPASHLLRGTPPSSALLLSILRRQLHPDPPRRQTHPLRLIHTHTRVVPLQQGHICSLGAHVCQILLCLSHAILVRKRGCLGVEVLAEAVVEGRSLPEDRMRR